MVALDATIHALTAALSTFSQRFIFETVDNLILPNEIKPFRVPQKPIVPRGTILTVCQHH
jgi:hypothetical protein